MAVLELDGVVGGYGDTQILHGVSIRVDPGQIVVVIGPNGAGKSTAMKAVFGLLRLGRGRVLLDDVEITNMPPAEVVRQGVCYVPQTSNVFPSLTVQENLEMGAFVREDDFRPRLAEIYEMFPPLAEKRRQAAGTLSGGQRQMVAMGKALMLEPKILLLDEPTAGLSPKFRGEIFSTVKAINAAGTPIMMVEQNAKQALGIADRGYILVDGHNKLDGTGRELLDDPEVAEMFLGGGKAAERPVAEFVNFYLIPGLVLGSIYALGAIGITMTFGILRFANFSHGESMTLGVYFTWSLVQMTGWHPLAVMPIAMVLTVLAVLAIDRMFFRPLREAPVIMLVMASFGLMLMVRSVTQFFWGVQLKTVLPGIQMPYIFADTLRIAPKHMMIVGGAVVLMFAVHYLLTHTRIGKAMRAMSDSPELARVTGIDTEKVVRTTWIVGGALACAAGVFLAVDTHVETQMGFKLLLPMFAAAILGGVGRPYGAMVGGLVIGVAEELSTYHWIGTTALLEPGYKTGVAFAIMIAMLLWRPTGLFRGKVF